MNKQLYSGQLEVLINKIWYPISNLGFNFWQIQLACRYFGFKGGYMNVFSEDRDEAFVKFMIICEKGEISFENCKFKHHDEIWLNRFYTSKIQLTCLHEKIGKSTTFFFKISIYGSISSIVKIVLDYSQIKALIVTIYIFI